jgi:hypothetical protein
MNKFIFHKRDCQCFFCKAKRKESHVIDCTCAVCKNMKGGAKEENNANYKHGKYIKKRCSICNKLLSPTAVTCAKHKIISLETRKKISLSRKNIKMSLETCKKIGLKNKGRIVSEKTKKKHSINWKKRWKNTEFRNRTLKASMQGRLIKPNKPEILIQRILNKLFPKEYK